MKKQETGPLRLLFDHRDLLIKTTLTDIRARYAGSVLGWIWIVLYPLVFLGLYSSVFLFVFRIRYPEFNSYEYVAMVFSGLIPFLGFSEALGLGTVSIIANAHLIKNTLFPIDLIPVKAVFTGKITQLTGMALLMIALIAINKISIYWLLLPIVFLAELLMTIGLIWIISLIAAFVKDVVNTIPIITLMLMLVTPIAFTVEMAPPKMAIALQFNPLYYVVMSYRDILIYGKYPSGHCLEILILLGFVSFYCGYRIFQNMKQGFADNV